MESRSIVQTAEIEFAGEYLELEDRCEKLAADLVNSVDNSEDIMVLLSLKKKRNTNITIVGDPLCRLHYALEHSHKLVRCANVFGVCLGSKRNRVPVCVACALPASAVRQVLPRLQKLASQVLGGAVWHLCASVHPEPLVADGLHHCAPQQVRLLPRVPPDEGHGQPGLLRRLPHPPHHHADQPQVRSELAARCYFRHFSKATLLRSYRKSHNNVCKSF